MKEASSRGSRVGLIAAVILVVGALGYLGKNIFWRPGRPESPAYFYDEKTKKLFTASDKLLPPIDTESGPGTGVRAHVYTCSDPKDESKRFIAFLEKMTAEARQAATQELKTNTGPLALGFVMERYKDSILVRSVKGDTWVSKYSPPGLAIMKAGKESGGCARPAICLP